MDMVQWFFIILAANLVASITVAIAERVNWSRLFKRKKKRTKRNKKLAVVTPIKKAD
jgi:hypothetical protein